VLKYRLPGGIEEKYDSAAQVTVLCAQRHRTPVIDDCRVDA